MKNKRGLIGLILLIVLIALVLIGVFFYYQLKTSGLTISAGNYIIKVDYNKSLAEQNTSLQEEPSINNTNLNIIDNNSIITNDTLLNNTESIESQISITDIEENNST